MSEENSNQKSLAEKVKNTFSSNDLKPIVKLEVKEKKKAPAMVAIGTDGYNNRVFVSEAKLKQHKERLRLK